jgi:protein O-mannosyl-transferase
MTVLKSEAYREQSGVQPSRRFQKALRFAGPLAVAAAVWAVYGPAIRSPLVFDDYVSVIDNPSVHSLWPLVGDSTRPGPFNPPKDLPTSGRPLVSLSLAFNYCVGQTDPFGYHLVNLTVHILSALLLMAIVRRTLSLDFFGGRFSETSELLALCVALLWAVHPLQTEAVNYVTQRTELFVGFFYLAALYSSIRYWLSIPAAARGTWATLASLACLAGIACKEVMVTAPLVILLFERTLISGTFREALRRSWRLYVGLSLSWMLCAYLNFDAPRGRSAGFQLDVPVYVWWLTQAKVLAMYLRLAVWPWPLVIHYDIPYLRTLGEAWPWVVPLAIGIIIAGWMFWRRRVAGLLVLSALIILSPTLIVPIVTESAAERRMYLPLALLIALAVVGSYWLMAQLAQAHRRESRKLFWLHVGTTFGVCAVLAIVLGIVSGRRLSAYGDELTLWADALLHEPNDPLIRNDFGNALLQRRQIPQAMAQFDEALRICPTYAEAHNNLGIALSKTAKLPEAISHYREALKYRPNFPEAHHNFGTALADSGQTQEAIDELATAMRLKPSLAPEINCTMGVILNRAGRVKEAIDHYLEARWLDPENPAAYNNLAWIYATSPVEELRNPQRAVEFAKEAIAKDPNRSGTFNTLGIAYYRVENWQEAIEWLNQSASANGGGNAFDWFFLAMAHKQMGHDREARKCYDDAIDWMEKHAPRDEELQRFRNEAEQLLGIEQSGSAKVDNR